MAAYLFARGVVKQGHLHEFVRGVRQLNEHRKSRAFCVPEVLYGLFPVGPVYEGAAEVEHHRAHHAGSLAWTRTSEKPLKAKFAESLTGEVRRIFLLRRWVNKWVEAEHVRS